MEDLGLRDPPLSFRPLSGFSRTTLLVLSAALVAAGAIQLTGQNVAASLLVLSRDGRRALPLTVTGSQEMVGLDDLAAMFQLTVREDRDALTVSYKGRTIVLTPDQSMASVSGRLITLPAPPAKVGNRWILPVDFISRALLPIYDQRLELRRPSRLLIVGDLRVPRITFRQEQIGTGARITIESTPRAATTVTQDSNQRLSVKFDADAMDVALPVGQAPGLIQGYRALDNTTIAIDLGPRYGSFRASTQVADANARTVIDVLSNQADTAPAPATTQAEPAPPELPAIAPTTPTLRTLVVDAGHGGDDLGAKGAAGTAEKDVTLAIARRLKGTVEARLGLRVLMTRDDDRSVPVTDRTAMANNSKADLFVSLHANASFRDAVSGATIYAAAFAPEEVAANRVAAERLPALGGGLRDIELVPWNLAQIRHKDQSDAFANLVVESLKDHVPLAAKPIDHAPLRVLESANMPAVLVEVGYLSNAAQEKQIASAEFQSAIVQGLVDAIVRYRDVLAPSEGTSR
jgi:N-acetylmuramoyl-L-alanine amidase